MAGATPRVRLLLTPVLKLVIAVVGLLLLQTLVSALPMVREIPDAEQIPVAEPERTAKATEPSKEVPRRGTVVTVKELQIRVSGKGAGDPNRSPEVLQQEVKTHFSDLQEVYEIERASDPSLMGGLVLDLTIEPDGRTLLCG